MATGYAENNIVISVFLQNLPGPTANFQTVLLLVDEAQGTGNGLNGDRYRSYDTTADALSDYNNSYITAEVYQAAVDFFGQPGRKKTLFIGRVDTAGGEGYDDGFDAVKTAVTAAGASFYGVSADTRTASEIVDLYDKVEADAFRVYVFQSADADWLTTGGAPAAFTDFSDVERTACLYHTTNTEWADLCWLGNRLEFDPDDQSAGWSCSLENVAAYSSVPDATAQGFAKTNNANIGLPLGAETFWVDRGVTGEGSGTTEGRPIDHIVSVDWFKTRLEEDLIDFKVEKAGLGEKIPVNPMGQRMIYGLIDKRVQQAIDAGHCQEQSPTDDTVRSEVESLTITAADITNKRLRFRVQLVLVTGAIEFQVDVYARAS